MDNRERTETTLEESSVKSSPIDRFPDTSTSDIVLLYFRHRMSASSIGKIFSVEESEISRIVSNFASQFSRKEYMENVLNQMANQSRKKRQASTVEPDGRDKEIAMLRQQLTQAQLKAEVYAEMIRQAEMMFHIPIRKKSGAK